RCCFFSGRRRHTSSTRDWSSDVCSSDLAYFLKVYGAPAGSEELHSSINAMKSMALNEPGFEKVFNGKDFTGIKFVVGANCAPRQIGRASCRETASVAAGGRSW